MARRWKIMLPGSAIWLVISQPSKHHFVFRPLKHLLLLYLTNRRLLHRVFSGISTRLQKNTTILKTEPETHVVSGPLD